MPSSERILDTDLTFFRGAKSDSDPGQLPLGYYFMGINSINAGGLFSCRPGYRCIISLPKGNLQGATIFRPKVGLEQIVIAIDGNIYVAEWPFSNFRLLENVKFTAHAKQIFWALTIQTAQRKTNDFVSAIEVIPPRVVLFMQDGGATAPAFYDGSQSGHIRDVAFETPTGASMVWVGDRLWVARGSQVFASDIGNPFSFREQIYLGGVSSFLFTGDVTAMASTPSLEFPQLVVFTATDTSILQANIRNRELWPVTDLFQREIFQIGCASQRSVVSHFGRLSWFAPFGGIVFFDAATVGKLSARIPVRDNEMLVSKLGLHEDLSLVAGAAFGQYLLTSVPSFDLYNKHTWVLNNASLETITDESGPSWCGFWLGTRPVEWVYGTIAGAERIYHVSTDEDGENRLWEAFLPDRLDNGCPIMWALETRGYFGQTSQSRKLPGGDCRFGWAKLKLIGIEEDLDLGVFYAGGIRGAYKPILAKKFSIARGSLSYQETINANSELFAFKAQTREAKTEDANQQDNSTESGSCPVEDDKLEIIDESFQLLVVAHGPAAIRQIQVFGYSIPEELSGDHEACISESPVNALRFDGSGARAETLKAAIASIVAKPLRHFTANKTVVLEDQGISAVGFGSSESIVSQAAADRVAEKIATRQAEIEIINALPPVLSIGLE